jgi:2'-5' RNA ligase
MGAARYAVYLAPEATSALWRFGSRVIGRDAASGELIVGYAPAGFDAASWRAATEEPRRYGFHATLKAPLRLRESCAPEEFERAVKELASSHKAFSLAALDVSVLRFSGLGFVALTPPEKTAELVALEADAVSRLDSFRAPLTQAERARRKPEGLTPRQRENFDRFGYPYVLEEFRLHLTLSNALADPDPVCKSLAGDFAKEVVDREFIVDAIALFIQDVANGDFRIARRYPLS